MSTLPHLRPPDRSAVSAGAVTAAPGEGPRPAGGRPGPARSRDAPIGKTGRPHRLRVEIRGAVQGVGFRPFVYRLAHDLGLPGWILNDARGVFLEVEGSRDELERFLHRLRTEIPPRAEIHHLESRWLEPEGFSAFTIRESAGAGSKRAVVLADVATCPACLQEVLDPADRRHRYPFTNCTDCGPRFTIVRALPYDRPHTTMAGFPMCPACRREYGDPLDRRFHAQPNACPECGPRLALWDPDGRTVAEGDGALRRTAEAVTAGAIVAVKGLGGFHLVADATDDAAVAELRRRKVRRDKPLALMVPDLAAARALCEVDDRAAELLASAEAPIVLLPRRRNPALPLAEGVAPGRPELGLMLPYTPLHHLLMAAVGRPVVATSGNLSEEPIVTGEADAAERLEGIADHFLVHDRPIARHADDSVVRPMAGAPRLLRRARGHAPLPLALDRDHPTLLAVGAHLKNTVALSLGDRVFLSQHLGDMENPRSRAAFEAAVADFLDLWEARPVALVHDLHPDYPTTRWAEAAVAAPADGPLAALAGLPRFAVQHHHAHLAACLAENRATGAPAGEVLGFTWDGTGYGPDGTIWGGEALLGDAAGFERVARLRPFRLPGGDAAVREPRRSALALVRGAAADGAALPHLEAAVAPLFRDAERRPLERMLESGFNSPVTTSAGRLFDGVAALAGLHPRATFEGQAAMALEAAVLGESGVAVPALSPALDPADAYPLPVVEGMPSDDDPYAGLELDWRPLVAAVAADVVGGATPGRVAVRFHAALVAALVEVARQVFRSANPPTPRVALSGGCFQNRVLVEGAKAALEGAGFPVLLHRRVPPNDGGVAFGQVAVAAARLARGDAGSPPSPSPSSSDPRNRKE